MAGLNINTCIEQKSSVCVPLNIMEDLPVVIVNIKDGRAWAASNTGGVQFLSICNRICKKGAM